MGLGEMDLLIIKVKSFFHVVFSPKIIIRARQRYFDIQDNFFLISGGKLQSREGRQAWQFYNRSV